MIAYYSLSLVTSVCITDIIHDTEDYVKFYEYNSSTGEKSRTCKSRIFYTYRDVPYFIHKKQRIYLDECIKIDSPT